MYLLRLQLWLTDYSDNGITKSPSNLWLVATLILSHLSFSSFVQIKKELNAFNAVIIIAAAKMNKASPNNFGTPINLLLPDIELTQSMILVKARSLLPTEII